MESDDDENSFFENFHQCKLCPYRSRSIPLILKHVRLHRVKTEQNLFSCCLDTPQNHECTECNFSTAHKISLQHHMDTTHRKAREITYAVDKFLEDLYCEACDFHTKSWLVLLRHFWNCKKKVRRPKRRKTGYVLTFNRIFYCQQCPYRTRERAYFRRHLSDRHPKVAKRLKCERCPYEANLQQDMREHVSQNHRPKKDDLKRCTQCDYATKYNNNLLRHKTTKHEFTVFPYQCDACDYKTKILPNFNRHIKMRHTDPDCVPWFQCQQCIYKTKLKGNLKRHFQVKHTTMNGRDPAAPTACARCPRRFPTADRLEAHLLQAHSGAKPRGGTVKCGFCDFRAASRKDVELHAAGAHLERTKRAWHQCGQCPYKGRTGQHLRVHVEGKHGSPRWIDCGMCPFKTRWRGSIRAHYRRIHPEVCLNVG